MSIRRPRSIVLTLALASVLGVTACGQGSPVATPTSTSDSSATPASTATAGPDPGDECPPGADGEIWRTHLTGPLSTPAQLAGLPYVLIGDGQTLRSLTACGGAPAGNLSLAGPLGEAPAVVEVAEGGFAAFVTTTSGAAYRVDIDAGTGALSLGWTRSMKRNTCAQDTLSAGPVVHRRATASPSFQSTYASDIVYVATDYQCGDTGTNRVTALNAPDGAVLWSFNQAASSVVGAVKSAPTLDSVSDRLFVGTVSAGPGQSTLYAINVLTGLRAWSATAGSLIASPVLDEGVVFAADQAGVVHAFPAGGGSAAWETAVTGAPIEHIALFGAIDVVDSVLLVAAGGRVIPVTYAGVAQPPIDVSGAEVSTGVLAFPSEGAFYVGASDGRGWQIGIFGEAEAHRSVGEAAVCCGALVDGPGLILGSSDGELVRFGVPWAVASE